jgi:hypothetical protein
MRGFVLQKAFIDEPTGLARGRARVQDARIAIRLITWAFMIADDDDRPS